MNLSANVEEIILLTEVVSEDKQAPPTEDSEDLMPVSVFLEQLARAGYV